MFANQQLLDASDKCRRGVSWKSSTQMYYMKRLLWIANLQKDIENKKYKPKRQYTFKIHERGKERIIKACHISDRVVQRAFNENILKPALYPRLIYDNAASQPGKGTDFCLKRLEHHLHKHYRKYSNNGYALLIDFSNYFGSINKDILISKIEPYLTPEELDFLRVLLINETEGLGLGSEINQTCAIFYVSELDHYIKEKLHIKGYCRYMDDLILIHRDKKYLEECLTKIIVICDSLDIVINPKKCRIVNLKTDWFTYLKKKVRLTDSGRVIMRPLNKNLKTRKKRLKRHHELLLKGIMDLDHIIQSYISWRSYVVKYDIREEQLLKIDCLFGELFGRKALAIVLSKFEINKRYYIRQIIKYYRGEK